MTHQGCCSSRVGAALDHDVDPALAASWITEAQRERRGLAAQLGQQTIVLHLPEADASLVFFINTDSPHEASTTMANAITKVISPDHISE